MHTVGGMFKRILTLATGVALGLALAAGAARIAMAWGWFSNRELDRSADYVRDVMKLVNENYVDGRAAGHEKLARQALHGMVEDLDPHSEFLEAKDYAALQEDLTGDFCGIGVQVESRQGRIVVIAPIADSPGDRAGIQRGDEITSIDGRELERGVTLDTVVDLLRGKPKTKVDLGLFRPAGGRTLRFSLVREMIRLRSVRDVRVLPGGAGYVQLTEFSERTGEEFGGALDQLLKQGANSLVIDLRDNPGGLLDAAVEVAGQFFKKGELIVYTQGRRAEDRENLVAEADLEPLKMPVAILINAGTASAAEVVTGALKDTGRAVVVGERSFGKGSVQSIFPLKNGEGVRLTTAKYFTPGGASIHEKGVTPQVEVVMTPEEDSQLRVQRLRTDIADAVEFKERFGFVPIADRQLQAAVDVLRGVSVLGAHSGGSLPR